MKVVVLRTSGTLEEELTAALLAAGHDVRLAGGGDRSTLPVGVRATDTMSADVVLTVVGGLAAAGTSPDDGLADVVSRAGGAAGNLVVVALRDVTAVEEVLTAQATGGWTLQGATTPHVDLHRALLARCCDGRLVVPVAQALQPVDASIVTDRVVRLVRAGPAGRVPDVGGPAVTLVGDLAAAWVRRVGGGIRIVPCPAGCRCWDGALLSPGRLTGGLTWDGWLDRRSDPVRSDPVRPGPRRSDLDRLQRGGQPAGAELLGAPAGVGQER